MFLNYIKEFVTNKIIKNSIHNADLSTTNHTIKTVGILFDETYFYEKEDLLKELENKGISVDDCEVLVFKNKIKKNSNQDFSTFTYKDLSWSGTISKDEVQKFVNTPFDLLISYYDTEKAALLSVTHYSKALFKVGFSTVDKKLNHFMITTNAENYKVFIDELFKYLRILNKI